MERGTSLTLQIERPAAGGRMIARHDGQIILVSGAIPGERVRAIVESRSRSVVFAATTDVLEPHASRRTPPCDPRCGGAVYAHLTPEAQRRIKAEVVRDALRRLGKLAWDEPIDVAASPERGYRMRARLHAREGRMGFYLEGTHHVCDAAATGQLLDAAAPALQGIADELCHAGLRGNADLELSENIAGDQRAVHVDLAADAHVRVRDIRLTMAGVTGLSVGRGARGAEFVVAGEPWVVDRLDLPGRAAGVSLRRHARAFFQGNRYLVQDLVTAVEAVCPPGRVIDLYAGVGLFGVSLAAGGQHVVEAVEGHGPSARDLRENAAPFEETLRVVESPVEDFNPRHEPGTDLTVVLDPPRTGLSRRALQRTLALQASRVVFVSCDVATWARDVRAFIEGGYRVSSLRAFDLFPNTAHVEVLTVLDRG